MSVIYKLSLQHWKRIHVWWFNGTGIYVWKFWTQHIQANVLVLWNQHNSWIMCTKNVCLKRETKIRSCRNLQTFLSLTYQLASWSSFLPGHWATAEAHHFDIFFLSGLLLSVNLATFRCTRARSSCPLTFMKASVDGFDVHWLQGKVLLCLISI